MIGEQKKGNQFEENEQKEERLFLQEEKQILHVDLPFPGSTILSHTCINNPAGSLFDKECKLVKVFQSNTGSPCNGPERVFSNMNRKLCFKMQPLVETSKHGSSSG